jgi:hypothetical protein
MGKNKLEALKEKNTLKLIMVSHKSQVHDESRHLYSKSIIGVDGMLRRSYRATGLFGRISK